MPSTVMPLDGEISEELLLFRRMVQMTSQQSANDGSNRQRVTLDAISGGLLLSTVNVVNTVSTVSIVNNVAAIAGEGVRQFEAIAHNSYANSIRSRLSFG